MKKLIALTMALLSVLAFVACAQPPKLGEVRERAEELIRASFELNTIYYGEGLPTYAIGSDEAIENEMYREGYEGPYEYVRTDAKYRSISEIKEATERVYSRDFAESVLYPVAFDGIAADGVIAEPRYIEDKWLMKSASKTDVLTKTQIVYDFDSMQVIKPGSSERCIITLTAWDEPTPDKTFEARITLVKQADGQWYLDSYTG